MASDAIDTALVNYLAGDSTLSAILTGGVHFDSPVLGDPSLPYASVTLFTGKDVRELRRRGWEECRYIITIEYDVETTTLTTIRQACARIDTLLDGGTFAISGYTLLKSERERRFAGFIQLDEFDEVDELSGFGGLYVIWAQAN